MRNPKIAHIVGFLLLFYTLFVIEVAGTLRQLLADKDVVWSELYLYKREYIVGFILILFSLAGLKIKESKGWIFVAQLFYAVLGALITLLFDLSYFSSTLSILLFITGMIFVIIPLSLMNTKSVKEQFGLQANESMVINNAIAIVTAILAGFLMWQ